MVGRLSGSLLSRSLAVVFWGILLVGFLAPVLSVVLNVIAGGRQDFAGWEYYLSGFTRSVSIAVISVLFSWALALPLISGFPFWSRTAQALVFLFFALQLQIGLIPRLYGYLGAFSTSGFVGVVGREILTLRDFESPLAYGLIGTSLATNIIYSPFFFLPLIARMFRVPSEMVLAAVDMGAGRVRLVTTIIKNELRWSIARYSAIYFLLVFADFACSDLIGGGKIDAFGKTIYRSLIYFQDYWGASIVALTVALLVLAALISWPVKEVKEIR